MSRFRREVSTEEAKEEKRDASKDFHVEINIGSYLIGCLLQVVSCWWVLPIGFMQKVFFAHTDIHNKHLANFMVINLNEVWTNC